MDSKQKMDSLSRDGEISPPTVPSNIIEKTREAVCGDCVHCDACKNMMNTCSAGSVIVNFKAMPVGACPHFAAPAAFARKSVDGEIASLKMALDERCAKYETLHNEYEKTREAREQIAEKFKRLSGENDLLRAQLDIVHLIFGKR